MTAEFRPIACASLLVLLCGCGFSNFDRNEQYLSAGSIDRVSIPEELDRPDFVDARVIPEVDDPRNIAGRSIEIRVPEALAGSGLVNSIVVRRLGDAQWLFLDSPPATVWPKIRGYWAQLGIGMDEVNPGLGLMESTWVGARDGDPEEVYNEIKNGARGDVQHKFQLRLERGIRNGSTEVYLEHHRQDVVDGLLPVWDRESSNVELEHEFLKQLAFYLGENINADYAVSLGAAGLETEDRAVLIPDSQTPLLRYRLSFSRAWVTVGQALENADIDVSDLDRDSAVYYVRYDPEGRRDPNMVQRAFRRLSRRNQEDGPTHEYLVYLQTQGEEVDVMVLSDVSTYADALLAEQLLALIKEYSS
ncbi:MAG: hypothetical protein CMQ05_14875 [Gammaproteobacteria bacterium]|nr:hypothetical protein [Gammaproteobacteria bacterium]RPG25494.1 MAG: outer membrane protein assembly factor BamC [Gammaproteobacteria bacterium TMED50]|tara:strand:- start:207 stop:1289 length:1083 start_codon:yes stop_codon:yes gene_type:complete